MNEVAATDMHPITRALMIALMVIIPLAVVILQRLPAIKEIISRRSENKDTLTVPGFLKTWDPETKLACPNCKKPNPADHSYCGFCGTPLITDLPGEGE